MKTNFRSLFYWVALLVLVAGCSEDDVAVNLPPVLKPQTFEVLESITESDIIGTVQAADPEGGNLDFSITENSNGLFQISNIGELSLTSGNRLDFEISDFHKITIGVSDGEFEVFAEITIDIIDVDETLNYFITTWETNLGNGVTIPTNPKFNYNYTVDWGDGKKSTNQTGNSTHTYSIAGIYTVKIDGTFPAFYFNSGVDRQQLKKVEQWGTIEWKSMEEAFARCRSVVLNATDIPNLSQVTSMSGMFRGATAFNQDISGWEVSTITNMSHMFDQAGIFNQDISSWNVSNVTDMSHMFDATAFNQDISNWDVSSVTSMSGMFSNNFSFNRDLSSWNVGAVTDMSNMFLNTMVFNQNLNNWDVSSVTNMSGMFLLARAFNQDISSWNVSSVTDMNDMFYQAYEFNQDISNWNVGSVIDMSDMFFSATSFNQSISSWDVSSVLWMQKMFSGATSFNQTLGNWEISSIEGGLTNMLDNSGLSPENYDDTLKKWSEFNGIRINVSLGAAGLLYCNEGEAARNILISKGWSFVGDNKDPACQ